MDLFGPVSIPYAGYLESHPIRSASRRIASSQTYITVNMGRPVKLISCNHTEACSSHSFSHGRFPLPFSLFDLVCAAPVGYDATIMLSHSTMGLPMVNSTVNTPNTVIDSAEYGAAWLSCS